MTLAKSNSSVLMYYRKEICVSLTGITKVLLNASYHKQNVLENFIIDILCIWYTHISLEKCFFLKFLCYVVHHY
jgi:hypothetical protein